MSGRGGEWGVGGECIWRAELNTQNFFLRLLLIDMYK